MKSVLLLFVGAALLFGWTVLEYVLDMRRQRHAGEGPYTFLYRDTDVMLCAVTGWYRRLGENHIVVTEANGWPHVIDRRDIIEAFSS